MVTQLSLHTDTVLRLADNDMSRTRNIDRMVKEFSNQELFIRMLGEKTDAEVSKKLSTLSAFVHGALLVFPDHVDDVVSTLNHLGYEAGEVVPSVVVKARIAQRYGLNTDAFQVHIIHGAKTASNGERREIEVFILTTPSVSESIAWEERTFENETHFAVKVRTEDGYTLTEVSDLIYSETEFRRDGGGYNPFEDIPNGGTTLMYFVRPAQSEEDKFFRRIEVQCAGNYSHLLEASNAKRDGS